VKAFEQIDPKLQSLNSDEDPKTTLPKLIQRPKKDPKEAREAEKLEKVTEGCIVSFIEARLLWVQLVCQHRSVSLNKEPYFVRVFESQSDCRTSGILSNLCRADREEFTGRLNTTADED
jgi:hypothetical protein